MSSSSNKSSTSSDKDERLVLVSFRIPKQMLDELDELVREGVFSSRSEAIRAAIRDLIIRERGEQRRAGVLAGQRG